MNKPSLGDWNVESLRATIFTSDILPSTFGSELWQKVVGTEAEEVTRKPALGAFSSSGPIDGAMLFLSVGPGRIDWLFGPATIDAAIGSSLGSFNDQDERFADRLSSWLQFPAISVNRLALGEVLRLPMPNRNQGYRVASTLLPNIVPDPEVARDFMYQINRPRMSKSTPNLLVNRLSKWGTVELNVGIIGSEKPTSTSHFVRLELDISTDKDSQKDLTKDNVLNPLFKELVSLSREIAIEGDLA